MPPVLPLSFFLSYLLCQYPGFHNPTEKQQMLILLLLYQFWLAEICICHKPHPTRDETRDVQIALPRMLTLPFFFYTSGTPHARHIHTHFELWHRPFHSSLLTSFFLLVLLWKRWLLDSCKRRLFHRHIEHATHCLFERRTLVGSSEAAVCEF